MRITVTNILTGLDNTMDLDVTPEQIQQWEAGALIQNVMPHLSIEQREFLISGMLPEEQKKIFGNDEFSDDFPLNHDGSDFGL
jgi:hypothetical protein